jgi:hypothetical protein
VDAALGADRVHRDDVLVPEVGGRLRLVPKPLELPGVYGRGERQHFQRDASPQRDLLGLVYHTHAAPADLAE